MTERWEFGTVLSYITDPGWRVMVLADLGTEFSFICVTNDRTGGTGYWSCGQTCDDWEFRESNPSGGGGSFRGWWSPID